MPLALSIPPPIPMMRIKKVTATAANCHRLLPKATAMPPNIAPNASGEAGARVAPLNAPKVYLNIQPTTTV